MPVLCFQMRAGSSPLSASLSSWGWGFSSPGTFVCLFSPSCPFSPFEGEHYDAAPRSLPDTPSLPCPQLWVLQRHHCCSQGWSIADLLEHPSGPPAPPRESQGKVHHLPPLLVCVSSRKHKSGCPAASGLVPTLPVPGLCPWNRCIPALPVGVCLDGVEQAITLQPRCGDHVLIYLCTSRLAFFAQLPKGIFINLNEN